MSKRIATKYSGVFYRESKTNGKNDKTYYIRYKDSDNKLVELKVGKFSEGIRENYCYEQRIDTLNKIKLGEQPPIRRKKEVNITTFEEFADDYFKDKELHNRDNERSKGRYKKVLSPLIGSKDVNKITRDTIEEIQRKLNEDTPKTINWFIGQIRAIFNHAILKEKFDKNNPASKITQHKTDNSRERYLTTREIKKLIKAVADDKELYTFTLLSLSTGGRLQTIMNIRKKDIDFENNVITLKDIKNNDTYKGFFDDSLKVQLLEVCEPINANDLLITYPLRTLQRKMMKILNDNFNKGLEDYDRKNRAVIHTLRHTFASHLAINNTPIYTIQKLLNHKDIQQTLRYAKLAPDSGKDMVQKMMSKYKV